MIVSIKKGKHRGFPPIITGSIFRKKISRIVEFDPSAKYDLKSDDQDDINKLFGLAFTNFWRAVWIGISFPVFLLLNIRRHHTNSARFGWRYDLGKQKVILSAYCYLNGERVTEDICGIYFWKRYECKLVNHGEEYYFYVFKCNDDGTQTLEGNTIISTGHRNNYSFPLGVYFGGNQKAPQKINIKITKP